MTSREAHDTLDLRDADSQGPFTEVPGPLRRHGGRSWLSLLKWSSTSAPVALLLLIGVAIGPRGINLLSDGVLSMLDPVIPVALATLGVLVGLTMDDRRTDTRPLLVAAALDAVTTMFVVAAGLAIVAIVAQPSGLPAYGTWTWAAAICAACSLTLPTGNALEPRPAATRLVELAVVVPLLSGGLALAAVSAGTVRGAVALTLEAAIVTVAMAAAAWLLLARVLSETEQRVIAVSALLLVGGVAAALSLSALFGGLVGGVFWRYAGRHPRETISRDVLFVQHPLVVLVLLVAGARAELTLVSVGAGVMYLALRIVGQFAGGLLASRTGDTILPDDMGRRLLSPGVFGVGFALNAASLIGSDGPLLLTAVVIGTVGSDFVAVALSPREVDA